jgi:2-oxoglutarate ferredoxin oxidoreductase subunit alpha
MSDTATAAPRQEALRISDIPEAVIRIAGNSQDGIQAIGGFLARLAGRSEHVLLAFYQHSYDEHLSSLKQGGIVVYDSDHVEPASDKASLYHHIGVPISGRTVEAIGGVGRDKGKNVFALGLLAKMFHLNVPKLEGRTRALRRTPSPPFTPGSAFNSIMWSSCSVSWKARNGSGRRW